MMSLPITCNKVLYNSLVATTVYRILKNNIKTWNSNWNRPLFMFRLILIHMVYNLSQYVLCKVTAWGRSLDSPSARGTGTMTPTPGTVRHPGWEAGGLRSVGPPAWMGSGWSTLMPGAPFTGGTGRIQPRDCASPPWSWGLSELIAADSFLVTSIKLRPEWANRGWLTLHNLHAAKRRGFGFLPHMPWDQLMYFH